MDFTKFLFDFLLLNRLLNSSVLAEIIKKDDSNSTLKVSSLLFRLYILQMETITFTFDGRTMSIYALNLDDTGETLNPDYLISLDEVLTALNSPK